LLFHSFTSQVAITVANQVSPLGCRAAFSSSVKWNLIILPLFPGKSIRKVLPSFPIKLIVSSESFTSSITTFGASTF
jgi:hypothetical protein